MKFITILIAIIILPIYMLGKLYMSLDKVGIFISKFLDNVYNQTKSLAGHLIKEIK